MKKKLLIAILIILFGTSLFSFTKSSAANNAVIASVEWVNSKINPLQKKVDDLEKRVIELEQKVKELEKGK